jgi:hypothetical protein
MKAFLAVHGTQGAASASVRETVDALTASVVRALLRSRPGGGTFHIEDVQDQVELGLMRGSHHEVARAYVLYRERRTQERARQVQRGRPARAGAARDRPRPAGAAGHGRLSARIQGACRAWAPTCGPSPSWPRPAQPVRRRAHRRGAQGQHPGRPHPDRERPGLHPRHRPPAAAHHPQGNPGRRSDPGADGPALRRVLPAVHQKGRAGRTARPQAAAVRPGSVWALP